LNSLLKNSRLVAALMFVFGILVGSIAVGTAQAYQSRMVAARANLYSARANLNAAVADKAGHRVAAIKLVNQAIGEVNAGIAAAR
jgi:hypothetical protein